jgi:hypothetical protein
MGRDLSQGPLEYEAESYLLVRDLQCEQCEISPLQVNINVWTRVEIVQHSTGNQKSGLSHVHSKSEDRTLRCSGDDVLIVYSNMSYDLHGGVKSGSSDFAIAILMCVYRPTTWAHRLEYISLSDTVLLNWSIWTYDRYLI